MNPKVVIFDFDGVIADSWWLTHKTSKKEFPELTEELHRKGFEGNIYEAERNWGHMEKIKIDYFAEYQKEMHLVEFFTEMEEVVRSLSKRFSLIIVSSSTNEVIRKYLEREGLVQEFTDILGADVHASKHEKIQMIFDQYHTEPSSCVMVTDTTGDIKEARIAGVDCIAVTWGFHTKETLASANPVAIADNPRDIEPEIVRYFGK